MHHVVNLEKHCTRLADASRRSLQRRKLARLLRLAGLAVAAVRSHRRGGERDGRDQREHNEEGATRGLVRRLDPRLRQILMKLECAAENCSIAVAKREAHRRWARFHAQNE
jgi:hypothetical protein